MKNLECVAQKMAEIPLDAPETPPFDAPDKKMHNLLKLHAKYGVCSSNNS